MAERDSADRAVVFGSWHTVPPLTNAGGKHAAPRGTLRLAPRCPSHPLGVPPDSIGSHHLRHYFLCPQQNFRGTHLQ